jgi:hypothetical protein
LAQTLSVLAALCEQPLQWRHGYALVEACWQEEPAPGRPRRHLGRLAAAGLASATRALAAAGPPARPGARAARPGRDVVAPVVS